MRSGKAQLIVSLVIGILVLVSSATNSNARPTKTLPLTVGTPLGEQTDDRPPSFLALPLGAAAPDTFSFGYVDAEGFAIQGEIWDFDHGSDDPFEGWTSVDRTENTDAYYRHITGDIWQDDTGNLVDVPVLAGLGSAWLGVFENEADALCWISGLGYGNNWRQHFISPVLTRAEASDVSLEFSYFMDLELDWEYLTVFLRTLPSGEETEIVQFTGIDGLAPNHPIDPPVGTEFVTTVPSADFGAELDFQLVFQMTSDGGWSDEDGQYETEYGALSLDDIHVSDGVALDVSYGFEESLEGWSPEVMTGTGSYLGVAHSSTYLYSPSCPPDLNGYLLELHDELQEHPVGQHERAITPPVDILNDVPVSPNRSLEIFADWKQYSEQPRANAVFYRPGWDYYPYMCPSSGIVGWSGRVGQSTYFSTGDDPVFFASRNIATNNGIPSHAEQIKFIYEIFSSCDAFSIPPQECTGVTNFTPVIDDIQIRFTYVPDAPQISYDPGDRFQDGFVQSLLLDLNGHGNADQIKNVADFPGNELPVVLGDSLHVLGPVPVEGYEYDTKLWFRVAKKGPGTDTAGYDAWRDRAENGEAGPGIDIENGDFAWGYMDSTQFGANASSNRYHSYYHEKDVAFDAGAGEISPGNEIIPDGILLPGTQIEYFVTANYVTTPEIHFTLPDTTGGFFSEFEILPGWVFEDGLYKFPALLYVDAFNAGAQYYIEAGFDALGLVYDRYDYLDASSSWKAPLARIGSGSTNGASVYQLLGYRAILVNMGSASGSVMWPEDYQMFSDWLTTIVCDGDLQSQGLIINGDNAGRVLNSAGPILLNGEMAATFEADTYRAESGDDNYCVEMEVPSVGPFEFGSTNTLGSYSYDAWGNGCPSKYSFDVLGTFGSGVGNRNYVNTDSGEETSFSQVVNEVGGSSNYRTVLDGVSWHHTAERELASDCVVDSAHIVTAILNESAAALEWIFDTNRHHIPIPEWEDYPCNGGASSIDVGGSAGAATQLFQNSPNPFNPRTLLRFHLVHSGPVQLSIFDIGGRKVRTLHDETLAAGSHEAVWDGTNDDGERVAAGVYWSQLDTDAWTGNKKMILMK